MSTAVATLADVPTDSTLLFRVRDSDGDGDGVGDGEREVLLVRHEAGGDPAVAAWINRCQHFTHVRLDKGTGAPLRGDEIVCTNHGAMFEVDTGRCTHGPCEGAFLTGVDVRVEDGDVLLVDPDYEYVGPGPVDDGDDLTSTSNVEF